MRRDIISRIHNDIRRARLIGRGATLPPQDAQRGMYKKYPRMERVPLPTAEDLGTLAGAMRARSSAPPPEPQPLTLERVGTLLETLRVRDNGKRPYPSGGGLYPIETYLVSSIAGKPEAFHYHPADHALERLWELPAHCTVADMYIAEEDASTQNPSLLIFTAVWERSACKYGDFAYQLSLIEAGHMAQNILLVAAATGLSARPLAGYNDRMICETLDIDNESEQVVYAIRI